MTTPTDTKKAAPTKKAPAKAVVTKSEAGTAKKAVVERDKKNGITRPKAGTKTGTVWEIADAQSKTLKAPAPRAAVLEAAIAAKINPATAATQYGLWRKYNGLEGKGTAADKKAEPTK